MNSQNNIINLDYLIELSKGNTKFVEEMIEIFLTENPEEIRQLEEGINTKNYELIKASAHKMKSTIPFVGLDAIIGENLLEIERLCTERGDIQLIMKLFSKVKNVCLQGIEELQNT